MEVNSEAKKMLKEKKYRNLILLSETSKQYESFYKFLSDNEEVTEESLTNLTQDDIILVNSMLSNIINLCQAEWKDDERILHPAEILEGNERRKCSLCGVDNKRIYYIQNKFSKKRINIGSKCVELFADISRDGMTINHIWREAEKNQRLRQLNVELPNIEQIVKKWDAKIEEFELLIPRKLSEPYLNEGNTLQKLFYNYLNKRKNSGNIQQIKIVVDSQIKYLEAMKQYCETHKAKEFIADKRIVSWLKARGNKSLISKLRETGYVSPTTIKGIHEPNFLKYAVVKLNEKLKSHGLKITKTDEQKEIFLIHSYKENVDLICSFKKFLTYFGDYVFGNKGKYSLSKANIFNASKIIDKFTVEGIIYKLARKLEQNSSFCFYIDNYDFYGENTLAIMNTESGKVVEQPLSGFVSRFKLLGLDIKGQEIIDLKMYIISLFQNKKIRKYTGKELIDLREARNEFNKKEKAY